MTDFLGKVYCDDNFLFSDHSTGKKIFIIVGESDTNFLVCKTTSQGRHYFKAIWGCNPKYNCYFISQNEPVFNEKEVQSFLKNTYIEFDELFEDYNKGNILLKGMKNSLVPIGTIKSTKLLSILQCIVKSEDVEIKYIEQITQHIESFKVGELECKINSDEISNDKNPK